MELDSEVIQLWFHYEEIAMHFNELIIQYRLQLLGGLGALGAIFSYIVGTNISDRDKYIHIRAYIVTSLLLVFIAAASLDIFYYSQLLEGAVKAIVDFEALHPEIQLSTTIANQFNGSPPPIVQIVYGLLLMPLVVLAVYSWIAVFRK